jgi:glycosidase
MTDDEKKWFKQSRSSKDNPYRDWYIWRPARYDDNGNRHPPNNWAAAFQGSVWEWDEHTQEYYLHLFAVEQPDLNWENSAVRSTVHDIVRFWLDRGCDGFRMDVINFISKDPDYPDAEVKDEGSEWQDGSMFYSAGPRLHEYLQGLGKVLKEYDAFSVGEMPCVSDPKEVLKSVGRERGELNMIFQFDQ